MFTGIIEAKASVASFEKGVLVLNLPARFGRLKKGSSLAVNGACLSVVRQAARKASFNVVSETMKRTVLGQLRKGDLANLERPLVWKGRIEGHFVLGHVDGVAKIAKIIKKGNQTSLLITPPKTLAQYVYEKGSVALNGVSLTVGKLEKGSFWVHLIPLTLKETTFGGLKVGDRLNFEADTLAKRKAR